VHDLRSKLEAGRRAKSHVEEQRDKWKSELDEQKQQTSDIKSDLERRLGRETEKVKVLEDLVRKMETEIERSTMTSTSIKSGSDRHSLDTTRDDIEEDDESEVASPRVKSFQVSPGSPLKTLFAEMANMDEVEEGTDLRTGRPVVDVAQGCLDLVHEADSSAASHAAVTSRIRRATSPGSSYMGT